MMTDDEIIAVVKGHKEGKVIQFRRHGSRETWHLARFPSWNFEEIEYRVKPEPLVCWVNVYDSGSIYAYRCKEHATDNAACDAIRVAVKMVEADDQTN